MKKSLFAAAALALAALPAAAEAPDNESWHELGEGLLRDDIFTTFYFVDPVEFTARIMESDQVPGRYKVVDPYANYPRQSNAGLVDHEHSFVIDASDPDHVYVEKGCLGFNYTGYWGWEYVIWSQADNEYNNIWGDWESVEQECGVIWGTLADGAITFPQGCLLGHILQGPTEENPEAGWTMPIDGWRPANGSGKFRVKLPGAPDYDVEAEQLDPTPADGGYTLNFLLRVGADVDHVQYGMCQGEDFAALEADLRSGGGLRGDSQNADMFGRWLAPLPYTGDGVHTFVAVAYNSEGTPKETCSLVVTYSLDESEWKKCGQALYTESVLTDNELTNLYDFFFGVSETYAVDVEVSMTEPGVLRLVNPYMGFSYASASTYDYSHNYYLEINAQDTDCVHLPKTDDGLGLDMGYGQMYFWSRANRSIVRDGMGLDEVKLTGTGGHLDTQTGVITMPANSMLIEFQTALGQVYWANQSGNMRIELPGEAVQMLSSGVPATAADDSAETWHTLDGLRADPRSLQPGLYIVRRAGKATKVLVR